jgi:voltage-gated potassium channel
MKETKKGHARAARHIWIGFFSFLSILVAGTVGYIVIEGWNFYDSFYMTILSISTTGFGEVHPLSDSGKIFTIIVIIVGLTSIVYLGGRVAQALIELYILRRRQMSIKLKLLKNHYIVCGYGRMGKHICMDLENENVPFVVIEKEKELVDQLIEIGYTYVVGDSSSDEILNEARIKQAKGLIAVVSSDAENVFTTLSAKALNPSIFVVSRCLSDESESKLKKAGADRVVKTYEMVSHRMANLLLHPAVAEFLNIVAASGPTGLRLEELPIQEGSPLIGKTLAESPIKSQLNIMIVVINRNSGQFIYNPGSDEIIQLGDRLLAIGETENLKEFTQMGSGT